MPHYRTYVGRLGRERGWPPPTRASFEEAAGPDGALYVGSPTTVATKILRSTRWARPAQRSFAKHIAIGSPTYGAKGGIGRYPTDRYSVMASG